MNTVQPPGTSVEARPVDAQATRPDLHVGAIGHRNLRGADDHVRTTAHALFAQWRAEYATVEVYSALAIGSDTILAEVALELGLPLVVVVPFSGFDVEFAPEARARYAQLLARARRVVPLPPSERSRAAFRLAGEWIVRETDILVAVWDGQPARSEGGTSDTVTYARQVGKPVIVVDVPPMPPASA